MTGYSSKAMSIQPVTEWMGFWKKWLGKSVRLRAGALKKELSNWEEIGSDLYFLELLCSLRARVQFRGVGLSFQFISRFTHSISRVEWSSDSTTVSFGEFSAQF